MLFIISPLVVISKSYLSLLVIILSNLMDLDVNSSILLKIAKNITIGWIDKNYNCWL
jgi:hypothetical protein